MDVDLLRLYKGKEIVINEKIALKIPKLQEIVDIGEKEYFSTIQLICSTGSDLTWQLEDIGIDYTLIDDYNLFIKVLHNSLSKDKTSILFGNILDFTKMIPEINNATNDIVLRQHVVIEKETLDNISNKQKEQLIKKSKPLPTTKTVEEYDIVIDRYCYNMIVSYIRKIHGLKRNAVLPGNEITKKYIIKKDRANYQENKDKPFDSQLFPLISSMVNHWGFKEDRESVFEINIFSFMDSVKRISKIKQSDLLLQSGYSGFGINLKETKEEDINWIGSLYK